MSRGGKPMKNDGWGFVDENCEFSTSFAKWLVAEAVANL